MSFTFNFPDPSDTDDTVKVSDDYEQSQCENDNETVEPFKEILAPEKNHVDDIATLSLKLSDEVSIQYLDSQAVEKRFTDNFQSDSCIKQATQQHTDLIPNVYEGGMKVWECAIDLIEYLHQVNLQFTDKNVLELGCGAGLPGILAMLKGASSVHLQDYNKEVIEAYTIPNVMINTTDRYTCTCRYFSGDWNHFRKQMATENTRYDIILTAETIYKTDNYRKLTQIFHNFLTDDGVIYVAAKSHYYGVGGGVCDFISFVNKEGLFNIDICHTIETGVPRQILKMTRKT